MARGDKYEPLIQKYAKKHGVPPSLIREQIRSESNFNPRAVSPMGAKGLTQFIKSTGAAYGLKTDEDFFNPEKAIEAQARYMSDIYNKQAGKDWGVTLAMYNMGPGRVKRRGLESIFLPGGKFYELETQGYVNRTLKRAGVRSPRIEGVLAKKTDANVDPIYNTPALLALKAERDALANQLKTGVQDYISTYEQDSAGAYNAQPDLDLMRELAQRAYQQDQESQMASSNLAAQLASLMNPAFAKQFQEQTAPRVNAARQYFANLGTINRQAMSASQATARAKRKSDQQLQQLRQSIGNVEKLIAAERARAGALEQIDRRATEGIRRDAAKPKKTGKGGGGSGKPKTTNVFKQAEAVRKARINVREVLLGSPDQQYLRSIGLERFNPEITKRNTKNPEALRQRKMLRDYEQYLELRAMALDDLSGQESYTEEEYRAAYKRAQTAKGLRQTAPPNSLPKPGGGTFPLDPEARDTAGIPVSNSGGGFADFKKRRENQRKKATGQTQ